MLTWITAAFVDINVAISSAVALGTVARVVGHADRFACAVVLADRLVAGAHIQSSARTPDVTPAFRTLARV